ncbi:flagellar protein FlhE [Aidingimonas halophila]|uniref:Flagellar protein FlhE n=1 Tax=Aidingimonas halophila TaxID=574349 RepID=A0A1H3GF95_9GAMM|nr:flagellar protein FlhE [Aidingimonas halophila]
MNTRGTVIAAWGTDCQGDRHCWRVLTLLLLLAWPAAILAGTAGSWVAEPASVRVAIEGRDTTSERMSPPSSVGEDSRLQTVRWRFDVPAKARVEAWICHRAKCIPLSSSRGKSQALAGVPASTPLWFQFRLPSDQRALTVQGLQVIAEYR